MSADVQMCKCGAMTQAECDAQTEVLLVGLSGSGTFMDVLVMGNGPFGFGLGQFGPLDHTDDDFEADLSATSALLAMIKPIVRHAKGTGNATELAEHKVQLRRFVEPFTAVRDSLPEKVRDRFSDQFTAIQADIDEITEMLADVEDGGNEAVEVDREVIVIDLGLWVPGMLGMFGGAFPLGVLWI